MSCTREMCAICGRVSRVGFHVPDEIWHEVVHAHYRSSILCLSCFTERADEHFVEWDKEIVFWPVSLATRMELGLDYERINIVQ